MSAVWSKLKHLINVRKNLRVIERRMLEIMFKGHLLDKNILLVLHFLLLKTSTKTPNASILVLNLCIVVCCDFSFSSFGKCFNLSEHVETTCKNFIKSASSSCGVFLCTSPEQTKVMLHVHFIRDFRRAGAQTWKRAAKTILSLSFKHYGN